MAKAVATKMGFWKWYLGKIKGAVKRLRAKPIVFALALMGAVILIVEFPFCLFLIPVLITLIAYYAWAKNVRDLKGGK
ncbi:MAG TPA: hypothetical protein VMW50_14870 [Dehalococcoidia bacterium]|nr:hypothetical protein [Dehalococcoidia bacterium]